MFCRRKCFIIGFALYSVLIFRWNRTAICSLARTFSPLQLFKIQHTMQLEPPGISPPCSLQTENLCIAYISLLLSYLIGWLCIPTWFFIGSWPFPGNTQQRRIRGQLVCRLLINSCLVVSNIFCLIIILLLFLECSFLQLNSNGLLFQLTNYIR